MKETTTATKVVAGRLMLVTASILFLGAIFATHSGSRQVPGLISVGVVFLCVGIVYLRRTRRQK